MQPHEKGTATPPAPQAGPLEVSSSEDEREHTIKDGVPSLGGTTQASAAVVVIEDPTQNSQPQSQELSETAKALLGTQSEAPGPVKGCSQTAAAVAETSSDLRQKRLQDRELKQR